MTSAASSVPGGVPDGVPGPGISPNRSADRHDARAVVSIVVLNWNGKSNTLDCLASLAKVTHPLDIIVVDNGSTDGSEAVIRAAYPDVTVLQTGANLGYAGGNNHGIAFFLKERDTAFVLLLNNDTVVDPSFVERLVACAETNPDGGIFGPKILYQGDREKIWYAGGQWDTATSTFVHFGQGEEDSARYRMTMDVEYINGCALMARREVVVRLGGLDDRFFLTYEEIDFCVRARACNFRCVYVHDSVIWHKVSASFGGSTSALGSYFWSRNRLLFAELHLPLRTRLRLAVNIFLETLFPILVYGVRPGISPARRLYWLLRKGEAFKASRYRDLYYKGRLLGVRDYVLRRFGDASPRLRSHLTAIAEAPHGR